MSSNFSPNDFQTKAFVLRRTNYGESDRILNLITPSGKLSAIAKGVRKEKSKLAGGVELFCLSKLSIHQGKTDFCIITSAKMLQFHQNILADLSRLELASFILKKVSAAAEHSDSPDFFRLVEESFTALNGPTNLMLIETWFLFNLVKASGEEVNLYRDTHCTPLDPTKIYSWDIGESALHLDPSGNISANEIKLIRLILTSRLSLISRVKDFETMLPAVFHISKSLIKL